ncbi:unnamed protein product [Lactuca virosa]|uniref:Glutathione S-transferase C-terminal domain-containing protein n=1 Tax=Lactuca virosa TaxID=75947 RepID=A0AAU9PGX0_9ASTR|nr:unnamed protein product [Lactuca virosa]
MLEPILPPPLFTIILSHLPIFFSLTYNKIKKRSSLIMEVMLRIATDYTPPLSLFVTAKVGGISITVRDKLRSGNPPFIILPCERLKVEGRDEILRYFCCKGSVRNLYDRDDKYETEELFQWLQDAHARFSSSYYEGACTHFDRRLMQRTFLVGDCLSLADIVLWSYLAEIGKKWERLMESKKYQNLAEWYNMLSRQYDLDEERATYLATYSLKED